MTPVNWKSPDLNSSSEPRTCTNPRKTFTSLTTKGLTTMNILHRSKAAAFATTVVLFALYVFAVAPDGRADGQNAQAGSVFIADENDGQHPDAANDVPTSEIELLAATDHSATNVAGSAKTITGTSAPMWKVTGISSQAGTISKITISNPALKSPNGLPDPKNAKSPLWGIKVGGKDVDFSTDTFTRSADVKTLTVSLNPGLQITQGQNVEVWFQSSINLTSGWTMRLTIEPPSCTPPKPLPFDDLRGLAPSVWNSASETKANRMTTQLYKQLSGNRVPQTVGDPSDWVYNALAFSETYHSLFAVSQAKSRAADGTYKEDPQFPSGHLLQIRPDDGTVYDLGLIVDANCASLLVGNVGDQNANDRYGGVNSGYISEQQNTYFFSNSSNSGTRTVYSLDLGTLIGKRNSTDLKTATWAADGNADKSSINWKVFSEDMAILSGLPGYAWGLQSSTQGGAVYLERLNLSDGTVHRFNVSSLMSPSQQKLGNGVWGKAWAFGNGNLGVSKGAEQGNEANQVGTAFQIQITNGDSLSPVIKIVSVSDSPRGYSVDAANNSATPTDLAISKKVVPNSSDGKTHWEIEVKNIGGSTSSGFVVTDTVPESYENATLDSVVRDGSTLPKGTYSEKANSNSFEWTFGELGAGKSLILKLSANRKVNSICSTNKATLIPNEKEKNQDPNKDNESTDNACGTSITKDVSDNKETMSPRPGGLFAIQYVLKVKNEDSINDHTYSLSDIPGFPTELIEVKSAKVISYSDGKTTSNPNISVVNGVPFVKDMTIGKGELHTYTVEIQYAFKESITDENKALTECENGKPGKGLYNSAVLTDSGMTSTDDACASIQKPKDVEVRIEKISADGSNTPLSGAEFEVHSVTPIGEMGPSIKKVTETGNGLYVTSLEPHQDYFLLETKSPQDYNLMPTAVKFRISFGFDGSPVAKIYDDKTLAVAPEVTTRENIVILQIADVYNSGTLPKTGGSGIWVIALIGAALIGAGAWWARRNSRK